MKSIPVHLEKRSYKITIGALGPALISSLKKMGISKQTQVLVISSPKLQKLGHVGRLLKTLKAGGFSPAVALISDGEQHKNFKTLTSLYRAALKNRLDRASLVIGLGGGVVTDLVGFFAATFMRGIRYVSVPTTLLAMVDAAIGGKTGVDLPEGKNLAGSFWQPSLVWIDPALLKTLPDREWKTGMAEVIKYGVIRDKKFFDWIEDRVRRRPNLRRWNSKDLEKVIYVSAQTKAAVVSADENEKPLMGGREILNFGHTIGHALEAATGYKTLTHGEAISIGMVMVGRLALRLGLWSRDAQLQLTSLFDAVQLPINFPSLSAKQLNKFWSALQKDKKHVGGQLRFVLPKKIGAVEVRSGIPISHIRSLLI